MTGSSMTKAALVEEVSRSAELPRKEAEKVVDTVFASIVESLRNGQKVELRGFGSFRLRHRRSRRGRNPRTGDAVDVPPKTVPYFKPGKELRALINDGLEASPGHRSSGPGDASTSVSPVPS